MKFQIVSLPRLRRSPVWTALRAYLKHGSAHLFMYVFGRFRIVRSVMVRRYSRRSIKVTPTSGPTLVEDVDIDLAVRSISRDGLFVGLTLRKDTLQQLQTFSSHALCFGEGKPNLPFYYADKDAAEQQYGRKFQVGRYNHALDTCPALQALALDTTLLAIARNYLLTGPILVGARMWWSFVGSADPAQLMGAGQNFHFDIDGYRALTFFFYLSDVGPTNGPHVYVRKSHVKKSFTHLTSIYKSRSDAEIKRQYGPESQVVLQGPAGFGFAEDIFGFHKGLNPESGDRLIVQVRYGLRDYGTGRND